MSCLSVCQLSKYFGERCLFDGVTFDVGEHDKVGLVGDNGCGKTTLFRILTGVMSADSGNVVRSHQTRVGYLEQHACAGSQRTLWDEVESVFSDLMEQERELQRINILLSGAGNGDADLIEQQHQLRERFEDDGGLYYKSRVRSALLGLGFTEEAFSQPVSSLSGGQRSKAAMARLLLSNTTLLLLDEPTNHLDIASVQWLEEFLHGYNGAVVVISHDRYFLDKVTNRTIELCHERLYTTEGNYSVHKALREKERAVEEKHFKTASREIKKLEDNITLLKQWNREKSIKAAESREKRLDRLKAELIDPEKENAAIHFDFTAAVTGGNDVLTAEDLSMGFGDRTLFSHVGFQIRRGERIFLLGPNGCGKTTLLKLITEQLSPRRGFIRVGAKVSIGYYDQTQAGLDLNALAIDQIADAYPTLTQTELRSAMAAFLFRGEDVFQPVALLSGGERARLLLLKLMLACDNLLLLDEPTNHLDIRSCEALEDALTGYDGTLFIVSHDRYFINRMADRILYLSPEGCQSYPGNYDAFMEHFVPATAVPDAPVQPKENVYKQRKEQGAARRKLAARIRRLEEDIDRLEQAIAAGHHQLEDPAVAADYARVLTITTALEADEKTLGDCMEEWEAAQTESEASLD